MTRGRRQRPQPRSREMGSIESANAGMDTLATYVPLDRVLEMSWDNSHLLEIATFAATLWPWLYDIWSHRSLEGFTKSAQRNVLRLSQLLGMAVRLDGRWHVGGARLPKREDFSAWLEGHADDDGFVEVFGVVKYLIGSHGMPPAVIDHFWPVMWRNGYFDGWEPVCDVASSRKGRGRTVDVARTWVERDDKGGAVGKWEVVKLRLDVVGGVRAVGRSRKKRRKHK